MRTLTTTEKDIVRSLINNYSDGQSIKLGELLLNIYPIDYIELGNPNDDFTKNTIRVCYNGLKITDSFILEAINLFDLLIRENYLVTKCFVYADIIGEKHSGLRLSPNPYKIVPLMNYYDYDIWKLLNSHYYVTNSLIDYAKDFKTEEQRHYDKEISEAIKSVKWSRWAAFIAIITLFSSVGFDIYQIFSSQKIDSEQINSTKTAIENNNIGEPLNVEIRDTILTVPLNPQKK